MRQFSMVCSKVNRLAQDSCGESIEFSDNKRERIMKKLLCALLLALPIGAFADHIDVIEVQLNEGCSVSEYVAIKDDFNAQWGAKNGYQSEVLVAIQSNNLTSLFWVGRTENAAAFGNAWDQWRNDLTDPESVASKLWVRFLDCSTNVARRGYDVY
jgi:hypothetical protein